MSEIVFPPRPDTTQERNIHAERGLAAMAPGLASSIENLVARTESTRNLTLRG